MTGAALAPAHAGAATGARVDVRTIVAGAAAFCAYFSMYAFRKPFAAATFVHVPGWAAAVDYKTALLIAQVLGYALSKLVGIRVIAGLGRTGRRSAILALIGCAWLALVGFAIIPAPWNIACLFLNGLPLGMIWGLVFSYLEGRRTSELLGAMLCASFILSSGAVKTIATWLMQAGVDMFWMPAATGLLFVPLLLVSTMLLERLPPPDARDEAERVARTPLDRAGRVALLRGHGMAMILLVTGYVALTAVRDFRDGFAPELWAGLGYPDAAGLLSESEVPVTLIALGGLGAMMLIRDNLHALLTMHGVIIAGAVLIAGATAAFQAGLLSPILWMILTGAGLYLAYTPFNAMLFDRMIAAIGRPGNAGFLIYIADASGYVGSVVLLLYRSFAAPHMAWVRFFSACLYATAALVIVATMLSMLHFARRARRRTGEVRHAAS